MFYPIPASDRNPYFENVELLLPMDGSNGSTTFVDSSKNGLSIGRIGNPVISDSIKKYGSGSANFQTNSAGSYASALTVALSTGIGTNQFTLEFWVWLTSISQIYNILDARADSGFTVNTSTANTFVILYSTSLQSFRFGYGSPAAYINGTSTISINTWYHIAVSRDSDNLTRFFIDGVLQNSATVSNNLSNRYWTIGAQITNFSSFSQRFIDDLQLNVGRCNYTDNFSPPIKAHPTLGGDSFSQKIYYPIIQPNITHQIGRLGV